MPMPMSHRSLFPVAVAALILGACAAAMPGYSPPPFKEKKTSKLPQSSGEMADGRYELSETEKQRDCKHIRGSIEIAIARLKDPAFRVEPSQLSSTLQSGSATLSGGSARGSDRQAEYARERARLDAYNRLLASKNCKTVDIEAELAKPPEPPKRY